MKRFLHTKTKCTYLPIFSKRTKKFYSQKRKVASETRTDGREMPLARDGDASRHRVARARGGWSRSCAPRSRRVRWVESGAILTVSATPPCSPIGWNRVRPTDATRARARNQFGGLRRHDDAIATDRSTTTGISPSRHLVSPSHLDSSLFTHTIARVPLVWFHRTMKTASAARFMAFYLITFYRPMCTRLVARWKVKTDSNNREILHCSFSILRFLSIFLLLPFFLLDVLGMYAYFVLCRKCNMLQLKKDKSITRVMYCALLRH